MNKRLPVLAATLLLVSPSFAYAQAQQQPQMSFFITSVGKGDGANLGGPAGPTPIARCSREQPASPTARGVRT